MIKLSEKNKFCGVIKKCGVENQEVEKNVKTWNENLARLHILNILILLLCLAVATVHSLSEFIRKYQKYQQ